jgi:hypothetical protein
VTDDRPQSPLSQDPAYWEGLAEKVRADAAGPLAAYAASDDWTAVLARRAPWLVAASAAAMLVLWLALPPRGSSVAFGWIETSLVPSEVAGTLISGSAPPTVDSLMVHFPPAAEEEGRQ